MRSCYLPAAALLLVGLVLLRPAAGHAAEAPVSLAALLKQGQARYAAGQWAEAEVLFRRAVKQYGKSAPARYRLGMTYYRQNKLKDAKKEFTRLTRGRTPYVRAYHGLGLVYLKTPNRAFEALHAFQQEARLDPDNADAYYHVGLAYLAMMSRGPLAEHPYVDKTRRAFERALELAPEHPDAAYRLGRLYEDASGRVLNPNQTDSFYAMGLPYHGEALDLMSAMAAYQRQLKSRPDHPEALRALGILQSRLGNYAAARKTFEHLRTLRDSTDTELLADLALMYWRARDWRRTRRTLERLLPRLPEKERVLFDDLRRVTSGGEAKRYTRASEAERRHIRHDFWAARDPVPLTEENERIIEHEARILYARRAFGGAQFPWDRRGDIVVRYGLPDAISQGTFVESFSLVNAAPSYPHPPPRGERRTWSETWTYLHPPMRLTFDNVMFSRRYDFPPVFARYGGVDYEQSYFVARRTIKETPERHIPRELGLPMPFAYDAVPFRREDGTTRIEIAYGVPVEVAAGIEPGYIERALDLGAVLYDGVWKRVAVDSIWTPLFVPSQARVPGLAVAVRGFEAPPGDYRIAMQAYDRINRRFGVERDSLRVPDFTGPGLKLSGIRLATRVPPEVEAPDLPMHGGARLAPNPARRYPQGAIVPFYLEIYDLSLDANGRSRYRIDVAVTTEAERVQPGHVLWRLLARAERALHRRKEQRTVTMTFEQDGRAGMQAWSSSIDTSEMGPGRYRLSVKVIDLAGGDSASRHRVFRIE